MPVALLAGLGLFLLLTAYWYWKIRPSFFPYTDDFALFVHSTRVFHAHPAEWFLRGFADYFRPYPDLAISYSEFLRPADNAVLYLCSLLLRDHWSSYLLLNYLLLAATVATVVVLAKEHLPLSWPLTVLVTLASAVAPALTYQVLYHPSFAFDLLGALAALLCAVSLLGNRLALAWAFALAAVLTKETAFYVPVAAAASVLFVLPDRKTMRDAARAVVFLLPLALMVGLRTLDFHRSSGVYVLNAVTPKALLRTAAIGATRWPFALPGEQNVTERSLHNLASLGLTFVLWLLIAVFLVRLLRTPPKRDGGRNRAWAAQAVLLLFLLGSLALPVLLNLTERFGASAYPLLFLALGALAANSSRRSLVRWTAIGALGAVTLAGAAAMRDTFSGAVLQKQIHQWALARGLVETLQADRHAVRFLLGDSSESYSSPEAVQAFAGTAGRIVPILSRTASDCATAQSITLRRKGPTYRMESVLPAACGEYLLIATGKPPGDPGTLLERNLPEAHVVYRSPAGTEPDIYAWKKLQVELTPAVPDYAILAPDLDRYQYRVLASEPAR